MVNPGTGEKMALFLRPPPAMCGSRSKTTDLEKFFPGCHVLAAGVVIG